MEHAKFVSDVVQKMTDNCVNRLMDRAIIKDDRFRKDIAADTRQFEQDTKNIQKIIDGKCALEELPARPDFRS